MTVQDFIERYLLGDRHSAYPVKDHDGTITGLVTLAQLRHVSPESRATTLIGEIALPFNQVTIAAPDEAVTTLLERLASGHGHRALVVDGGASWASSPQRISPAWSTCAGSPDPPPLRTDTDVIDNTTNDGGSYDSTPESAPQSSSASTVRKPRSMPLNGPQMRPPVVRCRYSCWPSSKPHIPPRRITTAISNTLRPPCGRREPWSRRREYRSKSKPISSAANPA